MKWILPLILVSGLARAEENTEGLFVATIKESVHRHELRSALQALEPGERSARESNALAELRRGHEKVKRRDFVGAAVNYRSAVELNPDLAAAYFGLGQSHFRRDQFANALIYLDQAVGPDVNEPERLYLSALATMRLGQNSRGAELLENIVEDGDPKFGPMAALNLGLAQREERNYTAARTSFEYVVQRTTDPRLKTVADKQLRDLAEREFAIQEGERNFAVRALVGVGIDTNVLSVAQTSTATNVMAERNVWMVGLSGRMYRADEHSLNADLEYSDTYSLSTSLKANSALQSADPRVITVSIPYRFRGGTLPTPNIWTVTPFYSMLAMSLDEVGRQTVVTTTGADLAWKTSRGSWFDDYQFRLASDKFDFVAGPNEDQTGTGFSFAWSTRQQADDRMSLGWGLGFTQRNANGDNSKYRQMDARLNGGWPLTATSRLTAGADVADVSYFSSANGRHDVVLMVSVGRSAVLSSTSTLCWDLRYVRNQSNIEQSTFDRVLAFVTYGFQSR